MVGNAELAKEYNYRPQSKLSECQLDVNDQKAGRQKTGFNFSSPQHTPAPLLSLFVYVYLSLPLACRPHLTALHPGGGR